MLSPSIFRRPGNTDLSFTVPREGADRAAAAVRPLAGGQIAIEPNLAKRAVSGVGMRPHSDVATVLFEAFADASINSRLVILRLARDVDEPHDGSRETPRLNSDQFKRPMLDVARLGDYFDDVPEGRRCFPSLVNPHMSRTTTL